jgi:hypothetical protein
MVQTVEVGAKPAETVMKKANPWSANTPKQTLPGDYVLPPSSDAPAAENA